MGRASDTGRGKVPRPNLVEAWTNESVTFYLEQEKAVLEVGDSVAYVAPIVVFWRRAGFLGRGLLERG